MDSYGLQLFCFRARFHFKLCLFIVFPTNPVSSSESCKVTPCLSHIFHHIWLCFDSKFSMVWKLMNHFYFDSTGRQGSHSLEKSLNFWGSPWIPFFLEKALNFCASPWIFFKFECSGLESIFKYYFACLRQN